MNTRNPQYSTILLSLACCQFPFLVWGTVGFLSPDNKDADVAEKLQPENKEFQMRMC